MNDYTLGSRITFNGRQYEVRGDFGAAVKLQPCCPDGKPSRGRPRNALKAALEGADDLAAAKAAKGVKPAPPAAPKVDPAPATDPTPADPPAKKNGKSGKKNKKGNKPAPAPVVVAKAGPKDEPEDEIHVESADESGPNDGDTTEVSLDSYAS